MKTEKPQVYLSTQSYNDFSDNSNIPKDLVHVGVISQTDQYETRPGNPTGKESKLEKAAKEEAVTHIFNLKMSPFIHTRSSAMQVLSYGDAYVSSETAKQRTAEAEEETLKEYQDEQARVRKTYAN